MDVFDKGTSGPPSYKELISIATMYIRERRLHKFAINLDQSQLFVRRGPSSHTITIDLELESLIEMKFSEPIS